MISLKVPKIHMQQNNVWKGLVRTRNSCFFFFLPENKMLIDSYFTDTKTFPTVYRIDKSA